MPTKPEILKRREVCASRLFRVEELELRFSNGVERTYERLCSGGGAGAVIVVPLLNDKEFVLVREYGAGVEGYPLVLPKGKVDAGESFCEAANRELMEEAGYGAHQLTPLKRMTQSPSYMPHSTQIVVARQLYPQRCEGDEPEEMEVETWPIDDIPGLVARADFAEARSIAALYLARDWLLKSQGGS